jgi:transposase
VGASKKRKGATPSGEVRGPVLEVLKDLLTEGRGDDVLSLVTQLVDQNASLTIANASLATQNASLTTRTGTLTTKVADLERRLAQVAARFKKSEVVSKAQLVLFLDALARHELDDAPDATPADDPRPDANGALRQASGIDDADEPKTRPPRAQPTGRQPAPASLPRVPNPIVVPAAERACPRCGLERTCIDHETTEVIELVPAKVIVRQDQREKLACLPCEGALVRAPLGAKVVVGGKFGLGLVVDLLVGKYDDGLPLHRQKARLARLGLDVSVSTLADQITWITDLMRPLWRAAMAEVIAAVIMHLDATGLIVLDRAAPNGKRIGALWGYVGDNHGEQVAAYVYNSTGKKVGQQPGEMGPEDMLGLRTGFTVADAWNGFDASFRNPDLIECGCNMHGRRYFTKALDAGDARAALPLAAYKKLYELEAEIRDRDADAKLVERQARSRPVWEQLLTWARTHQPYEPPTGGLGKAIGYLLNHHVALGRFLESGLVPIDNGAVERLHVRAALSRKNFLFAGSDAGAERAAVAYTILGCCRLVGVNPVEYLMDVLPQLMERVRLRDLTTLLPARWKARRAAAAAAATVTPPAS